MARSYLGMLAAAGHRVERIILMTQKRDVASGRPLAPWLPRFARQALARRLHDLRMNHWPREFLRHHAAMCQPWLQTLARAYEFDASLYRCLIERPDYSRYSDQVDEVFVDGLGDPTLASFLRGLPGRRAVLFTGGGMVPAELLGIANTRFIHVHPGYLPDVRGADGLLWSMLVRGRPGATAFYMSPGLDMGGILLAAEFESPPLPDGFAALPPPMAYRLLYSFVDPALRAVLLLRLVSQAVGPLHALPAVAQREDEGVTFHFMNERIRRLVYRRLEVGAAS
ncbi:hypothetical protein LRS03_23850 [Rhizobacter sp. J219]|uniref:hypothetical protein n=1 Tax=Rhizobacter sp. J219 TaxID=2898430 RepID=UPI0021514B8A|nr:hypothetical protein [Rhizobacter sp. J219]MCR5885726.1 hypothetical protein [Rhizobacter sp. J219]